MTDYQQIPPDIAGPIDGPIPRKAFTDGQQALFELCISVELLCIGFIAGRFTNFVGI